MIELGCLGAEEIGPRSEEYKAKCQGNKSWSVPILLPKWNEAGLAKKGEKLSIPTYMPRYLHRYRCVKERRSDANASTEILPTCVPTYLRRYRCAPM